MAVVHNLFLGTAKFIMTYWIENEVITKHGLRNIEAIVEQHKAPRSAGRLPAKIFSGFSAD